MCRFFKFWLLAVRDAWTKGWAWTGVLSQLSWLAHPLISELDKNPSYLKHSIWWDWLKFDNVWWAPFIPLLLVALCYIAWAPYKSYKTIEAKLGLVINECDKLQTPKLTLSCNSEEDPESAPDLPLGGNRFLRVVVETQCIDGIKGSNGDLLRIWKDGNVIWRENWPLSYAPSQDKDARAKTISHKKRYPLDVLAITTATAVIGSTTFSENRVFIMKYPSPEIPIIKRGKTGQADKELFPSYGFGKYIFDISVSGDRTVTSDAHLEFEWTNDWRKAKLIMLGYGHYSPSQ
jgi:hypothetical protein